MDAPIACPKCGAAFTPGVKFCAKCGYQVQASEAERRDIGARVGLKHEKQKHQQRIRSGRTTILVVAILTMIGAVAVYFIGTKGIEDVQRQNDALRGNPEYDQASIEEATKENRKLVAQITLLAAISGVLSLVFLGLWFWAKTKPLPATMAALILFVTVQLANVAIDPKTLVQGILIKVIIIAFLIKSVDSARKYQRMQEHGV